MQDIICIISLSASNKTELYMKNWRSEVEGPVQGHIATSGKMANPQWSDAHSPHT